MRALFATVLLLVAPTAGAMVDGADWMKGLPDATPLTRLSIPGAHDAGARFEPLPGTAKCQDLTITEQLDAGVRFLDIRCRHVRDGFLIHHGIVYQNLDFDGVLAMVQGFLKAHPGECVVMSIKEESTASENTRTFGQTLDGYIAKQPEAWFTGTRLPTLAETRGKIVLFRRFNATEEPKGIPATPWPDNTSFETDALKVQDRYQGQDGDGKWAAFEAILTEAAEAPEPVKLHVNFASGIGTRLGVHNLRAMSDAMNPRVAAYFTAHPHGHYGVIVMDFVNPERAALVYGTNFPAP